MNRYMIYVGFAGFVLVAGVALTWILRNSIIERLSGPVLANYGLQIVDVSLDALATRDATIGYLELQHASGTRIEIENLLLAVRETGGRRRYGAEKVIVIPAQGAPDSPTNAANLIRQVLGIPELLQGIDVAVGELLVDSLPTMTDVRWSIDRDRQTLRANIGSDSAVVALGRVSATEHEATLELAGKGPRQSIDATVLDEADQIRIDLSAEADVATWQELLARAIPELQDLEIQSGSAALDVRVEVPEDTDVSTAISAVIRPAPPLLVHFGQRAQFRVEAVSELRLAAQVPDGTWTLELGGATIRASGDDWPPFDIVLDKVSCGNGVECSMQAAITASSAELDTVVAESVDLQALLKLKIAERTLSTAIAQGAQLRIGRVVAGDNRFQGITATVVSESSFVVGESGWRFTADSIDGRIDNLRTADSSTGGPVFLEKTVIASTGDDIELDTGLYIPPLKISTPSFDINLPDVRGKLNLDGPQLEAQLSTSGPAEDASIEIELDTAAGSGRAVIAGLVNSFAQRPLKKILVLPDVDIDFTGGTVQVDGTFDWRGGGPLRGSLRARFENIAGYYSTVAYTGVTSDVTMQYDSSIGLSAEPAELRADFVDFGFELRDISARYALQLQDSAIDVSDLQLAAFGGVVRADPFSLRSTGEPDTVLVRVESLDLARLLIVDEFESVDVTGFVNGTFPVTLSTEGMRVEGGHIDGIEPGGVIRYRTAAATDPAATDSPLGVAAKALSNFEYETLTSDVDYLENGDLVLAMQIRGRNPDMQGGREVVLNLGVENNIPEMLRSLQASRNIEEILERRANR